eukprot:TRINITY_DN2887_c0_g1_i6.p1 TRINITY_DN2887_c0_g1~~TRINITY_DN2887_c0_g1_i6.p1  ORF type:complete len:262 (+),score=72.20 TRINITY_DN2887_c0_g1_i6:348-1133(+)
MCILKNNEKLNAAVAAKDLPKSLEALGVKGCKKVNGPQIKHRNDYEILFHVYLAKLAKEWSANPAFTAMFGNLKAANVDFNAGVDSYTVDAQVPPEDFRSIEDIEIQAQEVINFAGQFDPKVWADKEMASQVYRQVKDLHKIVNREVQRSEQNPEMDLTKFLDLNMKLSALKEYIVRASKGDQSAAAMIPELCYPELKCTLLPTLANEEVKGSEVDSFIPGLETTEQLRQLEFENKELIEEKRTYTHNSMECITKNKVVRG